MTFHLEPLRLHAGGLRCRVVGPFQGIPAIDTRDVLVAQNGNSREVGDHLLEQFELFPCLLRVKAGDPCDISTWSLKCRGEPNGDRIYHADEYDGNICADLPACMSSESPERDDDVDIETDQLGGELRIRSRFP